MKVLDDNLIEVQVISFTNKDRRYYSVYPVEIKLSDITKIFFNKDDKLCYLSRKGYVNLYASSEEFCELIKYLFPSFPHFFYESQVPEEIRNIMKIYEENKPNKMINAIMELE